MRILDGVSPSPFIEHSHEEVWNLVPGLNRELNQLARDFLPTMKRSKRLVIAIGAESLVGGQEVRVKTLAYELAAVCSDSLKLLNDRYTETSRDGLIGQVVRDTKVLGSIASLIETNGMDGESAQALRLAYRAFRNSCAGLWLFEFAPEGRPRFLAGAL